ncbi:MAG TPA: PspC domain-containing protein, partial [Candidatus Hydrogenedentes bacterium]|nr:PspC domain-containing protein [Candidatus Hydrogenedentota bacterium]
MGHDHDSDSDYDVDRKRDYYKRGRGPRHYRRKQKDSKAPQADWCEGRPIYRSRNGVIFGVCRGVAEYLGFSVTAFRVITVIATIMFGFWPLVIGYIIVALVMKPEPVVPFEEESEQEFYDSYVSSRLMALSRLKRTFDNLERRIRR